MAETPANPYYVRTYVVPTLSLRSRAMSHAAAAENHFGDARRSAFLRDLAARVQGHSNTLLPYHEISRRTAPESEAYRGVQTIPLHKVVGSVNRFEDFDRQFLPRNRRTMSRWKQIDRAWHDNVVLPPIEVIRVGDIYFVKDGNHRVSVARQHGQEYIEAEVVEERLRTPFDASMSTPELVLQAEYADFLHRSNLDQLRPDHDIRPGGIADYDTLWSHIEAHRRWLEEDVEKRSVGVEEAVTRWYDNVYAPLVEVMREHNVKRLCPNRTEADMYLWAMSRRDELYDLYTRMHDPARSATAFVSSVTSRVPRPGWLSRVRQALRRLLPGVSH